MHTIVDYWYIPVDDMNIYAVLDYVDLIETYFNQDKSKMKRAKILCCSAPACGVVRKSISNTTKKFYRNSCTKPSKYSFKVQITSVLVELFKVENSVCSPLAYT